MATKPVAVLALLFTFLGLITQGLRNQNNLVGSGSAGAGKESLESRIRDIHNQIEEARRDYRSRLRR